MGKDNLDVVGIGNAIVDVLSRADDAFLKDNSINKGTMTLIDAAQAEALYAKMGPGIEVSGGSAANTIAALASFGSKVGYIGKVAHDQLGNVFRHDIQATGVFFDTKPLVVAGIPTARCMILVTPDAQRTMSTYLGACVQLTPDDIDDEMIRTAQVTYLEGYLFDREQAKQAFIKAAETAHAAGRRVALSLSDPFCVDRHRSDFLRLVENHVDILFANEQEITSLYLQKNFEDVKGAISKNVEIAVLTRSEKGAVVLSDGQEISVPAAPVSKVIDTTGAGDQFAAGFLYGFTQGMDLAECGRLGALAAAEVISHIGPRPQIKLSSLLKKAA